MSEPKEPRMNALYVDLPEPHILMDGYRIEIAHALKDDGKAYQFDKTLLVSPEAFAKIKKGVKEANE